MEGMLSNPGLEHLPVKIFNKLEFDYVVKALQVGKTWKEKMSKEDIFRQSAIKWFTGCSSPKLKEILAPYKKQGNPYFFKTFYSILSFKDSYGPCIILEICIPYSLSPTSPG